VTLNLKQINTTVVNGAKKLSQKDSAKQMPQLSLSKFKSVQNKPTNHQVTQVTAKQNVKIHAKL